MEDNFLSHIILQKVPITSIVRRYSPDFTETSSLTRCINKSHNDSTPSMKIYKNTNSLYCFGCGFSGNPISVVAKMEGCSMIQAMQKIKQWYDIEEDFANLSLIEQSGIRRKKQEFDRTFDFYFKQFHKRGIILTLDQLSDLEDIYITSDLPQLKNFYEEAKHPRDEEHD